jgi:ApbE superfamily uncharacterized protein (UPF0280 family)
MFVRDWSFRETVLRIKSDDERAIDAAIEATLQARRDIERLIARCPEFRWSLEPIEIKGKQPRVVDLMLRAGEAAEVGPFAAVAGAISQVAAEAAQRAGANNVTVENGGDIAIIGNQDFRVGVFAGIAGISGKVAFLVKSKELPIGICTSSGTIGHSLSFGWADAACAIANEASIADAAATSIGNAVKGDDAGQSVKRGLERAKNIRGIRGCLIVRGDYIGTWGKVPELISVGPESRELWETYERYRRYGFAPACFKDEAKIFDGKIH